jgi:hypothetical protein
MATKLLIALLGGCLALTVACGSDPDSSPPPPEEMVDESVPPPVEILPAGLHVDGDKRILRTDAFTLPPQTERYLCFTIRASEAMKIQSFESNAHPVVHHFLLTTTTGAEPDGLSECDATFQLKWRPMFAAGAGKSSLNFPSGVVQAVPGDTRFLVQLHLLNNTDREVTDYAELTMTVGDDPEAQSAMMGVFGNADISLPPHQTSEVVVECDGAAATSRSVGFFPHMHMLGTSMKFELGPTADTMQVAYQRDPYAFDEQRIDSMEMILPQGSHSRLTCTFDNTTAETVTFGESSYDEMCFLIMFVVDAPAGCIKGDLSKVLAAM